MSRLGLVDPTLFTLDFEKKSAANTSTCHSDMKAWCIDDSLSLEPHPEQRKNVLIHPKEPTKTNKQTNEEGQSDWCYSSAVLDSGTTSEGQSLANIREEKSHITETHTYCKNTPAEKRDDNNCKPICCVCTEQPDGSQRDGGLTCGNAKLTVHMQVKSDLLHFWWRMCVLVFYDLRKTSGLTWRRDIFEKEHIWLVAGG